MTIRFINFIWPLLALAAIPLLAHLFARTRPPAIKFSSIDLLRCVSRNTMRVRKPKDLLLLLLRTLAVLAAILMVMRPIIFADNRWVAPGSQRNVVVIVDRSASMAYNEGGRTRFAIACAEASDILGSLSANDTANIIWLDAAPSAVFPEMGVNIGFLRDNLRKAQVSTQPGAASEALSRARRLLQKLEGQKEIHVISDFQRSTWQHCQPKMPPNIAFYAIPVAHSSAANLAITDLHTTPAVGLPGASVDTFAEISNFSDAPRKTSVFLTFGETRKKQELVIQPWQKSTILFHLEATTKGDNLIRAALDTDGDNFATDNQRFYVLPVREHITVALPEKSTPQTILLARALRCLSWIHIIPLPENSPTQTELSDVAFIPELPHNSLFKNLLKSGQLLIWAPPTGISIAELDDFYTAEKQTITTEKAKDSFQLKINNTAPSLAIFKDGRYGDPASALIYQRLRLPPIAPENADSILTYSDGTPAICRSKIHPNLILWNLPLDTKLSNFAKQVTFVPFIAELILRHSSANTTSLRGRNFSSGNHIQRNFPVSGSTANVTLSDSLQQPLKLQPSTSTELFTTYTSKTAPALGVYTWHGSTIPAALSVINFPANESDLRPLSKTEIQAMGAHQISNARTMRDIRDGREIWHLLLLIAILALFLEAFLNYFFERKS